MVFPIFFLRAVLKGSVHFILHSHVCVLQCAFSLQVGHQSPMKLDLEVNKLGESIVKGIVHQKMNTLCSEFFTYCNVIPNSYDFLSYSEKKEEV